MTGRDVLPNGMRMLQRVRVFTGLGRQHGAMAAGTVIGWLDHPSVVIRGADGVNRHVSSRLEWELLEDEPEDGGALIRDDGQVSMRIGNSVWTMTVAEWHALAEAPVETIARSGQR